MSLILESLSKNAPCRLFLHYIVNLLNTSIIIFKIPYKNLHVLISLEDWISIDKFLPFILFYFIAKQAQR